MWILIRLFMALCVLFIRRYAHLVKPRYKTWNGREYYEKTRYFGQGKGNVMRIIGLPLNQSLDGTVFKLTKEGYFESVFKFFGFNGEFQTGDAEFDRTVYIASDHPFFCGLLKQQPELRAQIRSLFSEYDAESISSDGKHIHFKYLKRAGAKMEMGATPMAMMFSVSERIQSGLQQIPSRYNDVFAWKALIVESVAWSFLFYAIGSLPELILMGNRDLYIERNAVVQAALVFSAVAWIVTFFFIRYLFKGSSRALGVIVEGGLLLMVSLPLVCTLTLFDVNIKLDRTSRLYRTQLTKKYEVLHPKSRRSSAYYSYHIQTAGIPDVLPAGQSLQVNSGKYSELTEGEELEVSVGDGRLGFKWIQDLRGQNTDD